MTAAIRFAATLADLAISVDDLLAASQHLERPRRTDRTLLRARRALRRATPGRSYAEAGIDKPRSGRPLGRIHLQRALAGGPLTRRARQAPPRGERARCPPRRRAGLGRDAVRRITRTSCTAQFGDRASERVS